MSVLKSKRKESQFEVFHHLTKMRKEVTETDGKGVHRLVQIVVQESLQDNE